MEGCLAEWARQEGAEAGAAVDAAWSAAARASRTAATCAGAAAAHPRDSRHARLRHARTSLRAALFACACWAFALPAYASYNVDIDAPYSVRGMLKQYLDIVRFAKRDNVDADQFDYLVTAAPQQTKDLLATSGYFSPDVKTSVSERGGKHAVKISVVPGPLTHVSEIDLAFNGPIEQEAPAQATAARLAFSVHEGDPFTQAGWDAAKNAALQQLQARRYVGAKIVASEARIDPRTQTAVLSVNFDSGPTFTLGPLQVSGARRYPEWIASHANPLAVGEVYDTARIAELQRQLQNTPYYASAAIDVGSDTEHPLGTPLHVQLSEYPYNNVRGSIGYSTDTGPHVQGAYSYLDTFGAAWPLVMSGRVDKTQQYGQVQLFMPPDTRGWTNSALASYTTTNQSDVRIYSARGGLQRSRNGQYITTTYGLMFYDDRLDQNAASPTMAHALVPQWAWTRRNVDDPIFPRSGNLLRAEADFAVKGIATTQTFARADVSGQQYVPVGRRDIFVFRAEFGAVVTGGSASGIPASLLFRAGGSNSVRGYSYESIGNNVAGSVLPTKYLLTGSTEYQHWFTREWGAATFFDIGTATDTWGERVFYPGVGVGARWRSPVGPVNIDLGYGLRNHGVRPYLTLGVAF